MTVAPGLAAAWASPWVQMVASAFWFSAMALCVKVVGQRLPTMEVVLVRALLTLVLSAAWLLHKGTSPWGRRDNRPLLVLSGVLGFGGLSCFYYAVTHLPLAEATVLHFTNPLITALLTAWLLGERSGRGVWAGLVLGLVGVLVVARPFGLGDGADAAALAPVGVAVALLGAVFAAAAYTTVRRLARSEDPLVIVFYFPLVSVPATLPLLAAGGFVWPSGIEWLWLLGVGVTTQLGQVTLTRGLAGLPAARAMAMGYLQIPFAAVLGLVAFGEWPEVWTGLGCLLIVAGAVGARRAVG